MRDGDGDGYGDTTAPSSNPYGVIGMSGIDCNDLSAQVNPGVDGDGDGFNACDDCDDGDVYTFVGAAELESSTACMKDSDEDGYGDDEWLCCWR